MTGTIPCEPSVEGDIGFTVRSLTEGTTWSETGSLLAIDVDPGQTALMPKVRSNHFYHVVAGKNVLITDHNYSQRPAANAGTIGRATDSKFCITNWGTEPARVIVMRLRINFSIPKAKSRQLSNLNWEHDHVEGLRCKQAWKPVDMPGKAEYELLELNGFLPRHYHMASSSIYVVLDGLGQVGLDGDRENYIRTVKPGDFGYLPPERCHGLFGRNLLIAIAQIPPVTEEDTFYRQDGYEYEYYL